MSLVDLALQLRDEQLRARVVHYRSDLRTSPELDAVTDQVVAELQALQQRATSSRPPASYDRTQREIDLITSLKSRLARVFRPGDVSNGVARTMAEASKRFARLFFESELCERIRGGAGEQKVMRFGAQALFHALSRTEGVIQRELDSFEYPASDVLGDAKARLDGITKELRNAFLSATMPELNVLVTYLNEVLAEFFTVELPPDVGDLAWEVVREGRLADVPSAQRSGFAIGTGMFPRFRATFERKFLHRLVGYAADRLMHRVRVSETQFRDETLTFVASPRIFSDVCALVCDVVYDDLYNEGFLDLPPDWRERLTRQ